MSESDDIDDLELLESCKQLEAELSNVRALKIAT